METSYKVMKTGEYDKALFYKVECDCGSKDHQLGIEIDSDKWPILSLTFYADLESTIYWGKTNWFIRQWRKIKIITKIIFTGYITMEQEFLLIDDKHIDSYINALKEGKEILKRNRERNDKLAA